jgi:hypothetical protein
MGDCTIRLLIESKLLAASVDVESQDEFHLIPSSHVFSADSSLVELTSFLSRTLLFHRDGAESSSVLASVCVIDASYHPAKHITNIIREHPDVTGPKSKTLQSMGWFPSGKLVILSLNTNQDEKEEGLLKKFVEWQSRHVLNEEEFGYNLPSMPAADDGKGVQWIGAGGVDTDAKLKPTDIFNAVQSRFQDDPTTQVDDGHVISKKRQKRTEQQRQQRLDSILNNLKNKKKTSTQVRNMLIKSRSVGDKKLRMEDRFHLEVVRVDDTGQDETTPKNETSDYRFYSRQTTAGKVASGVAPDIGKDRSAEFLVSVSYEGNERYRRLPNTMSLHDAQRQGWLNEFDAVLIRLYMLQGDDSTGPSKSVLDASSDGESVPEVDENAMEIESTENECIDIVATTMKEPTADSSKAHNSDQQHNMETIFRMAEAGEIENESIPNKSAKKKKPISLQVQNMLIKSKAKGNPKVKQEDRVFLEVIVFRDDNHDDVASSYLMASYWFFEKRKIVGHIIDSVLDAAKPAGMGAYVNAEIIVQLPSKGSSTFNDEQLFQRLPKDMIISDAVRDKLVESFGRVVLHLN